MSDSDWLLSAYELSGDGGGRSLTLEELEGADPNGLVWIHLHLDSEETRDWLENQEGVTDVVVDALLAEETRPRSASFGEGVLLNLRGVNLAPNSDPEDMVSVRVYAEKNRIISVRKRTLLSVQEIRDEIDKGFGPKSTAEFLVTLNDKLLSRMGNVIAEIDDRVDALEDLILEDAQASLRSDLWQVRRQAISLRRYISPQREALSRLANERLSWLDVVASQRLREVSDRITRYVEDLDSARERAAIIQDELSTKLGEQMNRNMYVLSVVAGIFLPLGIVTGLLGINVAGIPGEKWPWAFATVCVGLVVIGVVEYLLFRRLKWL